MAPQRTVTEQVYSHASEPRTVTDRKRREARGTSATTTSPRGARRSRFGALLRWLSVFSILVLRVTTRVALRCAERGARGAASAARRWRRRARPRGGASVDILDEPMVLKDEKRGQRLVERRQTPGRGPAADARARLQAPLPRPFPALIVSPSVSRVPLRLSPRFALSWLSLRPERAPAIPPPTTPHPLPACRRRPAGPRPAPRPSAPAPWPPPPPT